MTNQRNMFQSLHGKTFPGSIEAGDALEAYGFKYASPGVNEGPSLYSHPNGKVMAFVDNSNGGGHTIELDTREKYIDMAAELLASREATKENS